MTRALAITKRQARALIEATKGTGYAPVVHIGNTTVSLVPLDLAARISAPTLDMTAEDDLDAELAAFEAQNDDG